MSVEPKVTDVQARDVIEQVRRQLRREVLLPVRHNAVRLYCGPVRTWGGGGAGTHSAVLVGDSEELAERLRVLYQSLDSNFNAGTAGIGEMPPTTLSIRGRAGRLAIQALQRLLWWYTRSLRGFAESIGTHLQESTGALETLACLHEAQRLEIAALREEIRLLRENSTAPPRSGQ